MSWDPPWLIGKRATVRKLTHEEVSVYRAPFPTPESRRPTWRFPNEIPIAGEPVDVYSSLEKAHEVLALGGSNHDLIYLLAWDSMAEREQKSTAFLADPEWLEKRSESEQNGALISSFSNAFLKPTAFSTVK